MAWWNRTKQNIEDQPQREVPDGLFLKCAGCSYIIYKRELEEHLYTCPKCNKHARIGSEEYIDILLDPGSWKERDRSMSSADPLEFVDEKPYPEKLKRAREKTDLKEAIRTGSGEVEQQRASFAMMDFSFIGGSMGAVVGEKFTRAAEYARKHRIPFVAITASGGARMMESSISLMQMAKTSVALSQLAEARIPYITILTHPTTGGVTASFGMLGDVTVAEPGALIGFAGPRVIEQTIKKKLPEGFQTSEFLLEHGFVDTIVHRKELRSALARLLRLLPVPDASDSDGTTASTKKSAKSTSRASKTSGSSRKKSARSSKSRSKKSTASKNSATSKESSRPKAGSQSAGADDKSSES